MAIPEISEAHDHAMELPQSTLTPHVGAATANSSITPVEIPDYAMVPDDSDSATSSVPSDKAKAKQTDVRITKPVTDAEGE